jgi:membrane-bound lytic murein transglycosylase D
MQAQKSLARWVCCISIVVAMIAGCSKHEVKKGGTIPDSTQAQSTATAPIKRKSSRGSNYDTLWDRLFALYALPPVDHPDIDRELSWFANHPAYLERAQNRAEPFLYSIVKLVEKKNVPGEIALLPIVESAFQPNVVSPAKAAGIWQFIPSTGTNYGLKRNHSYDGRRDVYASTKAAIKYLKKLHGDFGDWLLAIAAYNCGEGAVGRAIKRNIAAGLPTDFWSLNLPQETRAYVPKLLAVSRLFADAEKYGISLKDLPNMAKYKPVKVSNHLDLALAADVAGISLDKLYELNPGFKGQFADLDGSYHLYIPAEKKAADFRQEVERLSIQSRSYQRPFAESMPVEPGAFQTFRREFQRNPPPPPSRSMGRFVPMSAAPDASEQPVERARPLRRSQEVATTPAPQPVASRSPAAPQKRTPPNPEPAKSKKGSSEGMQASTVVQKVPVAPVKKSSVYSVEKGETLYAVARKYSVDVAQLAKMNNIAMTTQVQAGQKLVVTDAQASKKSSGAGMTNKISVTNPVPAKPASSKAKSQKSGSKAGSAGTAKVSVSAR